MSPEERNKQRIFQNTHNPSIFDRIREACGWVARQAGQVFVREDRIPGIIPSFKEGVSGRPSHHPERHYLDRGEETVAFFLTLDTVNFGSGYFPTLKKRPGMSGYYTIAASLNDHFMAHGPFSAKELISIDGDQCADLFGQHPLNDGSGELMALFAQALNDLGALLIEHYNDDFMNLVDAANGSAGKLVEILAKMPLFQDEALYRGRVVPFYKRAQIAAADLHVAFGGRGPGRFADITSLTLFADNLVPHVLRMDGVLEYTDNLLARIEREELIPPGSEAEVEIRACALHAVELMVAALRDEGCYATAGELDFLLWNRGQDPFYKARPRHRARGTFY